MARFARFVAAVLGFPFVWALCLTFVDAICLLSGASGEFFSVESFALFTGLVSFLVFWRILPDQTRIYVLGHELTHAVWGLAFGSKVSNLKVRPTGGSVMLTKSNVWITLAPYFFPFWTVIVVLLALLVRVVMYFADPGSPFPAPWFWMFAVGFTWCFHACFTIRSLMQTQPDVQEYGRVFSWTLIFVCNVVGILLWMANTTDISITTIFERLSLHTAASYQAAFSIVYGLGRAFCEFITSEASAMPKEQVTGIMLPFSLPGASVGSSSECTQRCLGRAIPDFLNLLRRAFANPSPVTL